MMISRRALISMLPPVAGLALVAGCSQVASVVTAAPQIAKDVAAIADALAGIMPTIATIAGVSAKTIATISGVVGEVKYVASEIAGATTSTATSLVQQLGGGVATIASLLGGVTLPGWVGTVLTAATTLLPTIEAAVGIASAPATHRFAEVAMTPDQARAILALAAAK